MALKQLDHLGFSSALRLGGRFPGIEALRPGLRSLPFLLFPPPPCSREERAPASREFRGSRRSGARRRLRQNCRVRVWSPAPTLENFVKPSVQCRSGKQRGEHEPGRPGAAVLKD